MPVDGFTKPYEYQEEKRGILLIFIAMLLTVDLFMAISFTVQVYGVLKPPDLAVGIAVIGVLMTLFVIVTAVVCYRLKKALVAVAKAYLIARLVFMTASILILYYYLIRDESMIGPDIGQYASAGELTLLVLIAPLAYALVFSGGWYLYFSVSKRCKRIAGGSAT